MIVFIVKQGATCSSSSFELTSNNLTIKDEPVDLISHHQQQSEPANGNDASGYYTNGGHQYHPHASNYYHPSGSFHHHPATGAVENYHHHQRSRDCLYQQHNPAAAAAAANLMQQQSKTANPISSPSPSPNTLQSYPAGFNHPAYSYGSVVNHPQQLGSAAGSGSRFVHHQFHHHRHQRLSVSTPPSSPQVLTTEMLNIHPAHHLIHHQPTPSSSAGLPLVPSGAQQTTAGPTGQPKVKRGMNFHPKPFDLKIHSQFFFTQFKRTETLGS